MGFARALLTVLSIYAATSFITTSTAFKCGTPNATCNGLVGYMTPNTTTLSHLKTFFGINDLPSLLGANNFPLSTPPNYTVHANQTINIPFPCLCTANGTGLPRSRLPMYTVVKDDGLYHIAAEVFSGLVTYEQIQAVNNISDPNKIDVGQHLWIPLPCSCDEVGGERVVHYGHLVAAESTLAQIAQQYNTSEDTLRSVNDLSPTAQVIAGAVLDVPIKACTSMVENNSTDYPLLLSNATYAVTAGNCVKCSCDSAKNWTLQCEPSNLSSSCPAMQCQSADKLNIGNTTSSGCNRTTCAYAGYINQTILTKLVTDSTCPVPNNNTAPKFSLQGWSWSSLLISIHLVVLCLHFI